MFNRPTLTQLSTRILADIAGWLPGADTRLRRSVLGVIARVVAGVAHGLYGFLGWIADQVLPDTAEGEQLQRWATIWSVSRRPATYASGTATFTGVNGSTIEAGTRVQRGDGVEYLVQADVVVAGGVATAAIEADVAGAAGLADVGVILTLVSPVAGVSARATVASAVATGADEEDDASLRERLLERLRDPPAGGKESDYVKWAKAVPGVTRVWPYPLMNGLGTVGVTFVMDDRPDIIPEAGDVAAVAAAIAIERPVTADVDVFAPTPDALALTIHLVPDTAAGRLAVTAELRDMLARDAVPGGTILISRIREAVSIAPGENDNTVTVPSANVAHAAGHIAVLGAITWS